MIVVWTLVGFGEFFHSATITWFLTRGSTHICFLSQWALEMFKGGFTIDTTGTTDRTKSFWKTALHGSMLLLGGKVSVF